MRFSLQRKALRISATTEIELYIPDPVEVEQQFREGLQDPPYWARLWPAALALARFLLQHPDYTKDKQVLELAAGLGLPSLIASRNARLVLCTDLVPEAVEAARSSAQHQQLQTMQCAVMDWHDLPDNVEAEVLLLSDINYDPEQFEVLQHLLIRFLEKGSMILLSTPQRLVAKTFITPLLQYLQHTEEWIIEDYGKPVYTSLFVLKKHIADRHHP